MAERIISLIKIFDKEEYADAFLCLGEMFCQSLEAFKKLESDEHRGDRYEGITDWFQPDQIKITIGSNDENGVSKSLPLENLAGPVTMQRFAHDQLNLFCMYAVKIEVSEEEYSTVEESMVLVEKINNNLINQLKINEKCFDLGDFSVIIYDVDSFINKIDTYLSDNGHHGYGRLVKYYDPETFHGSFEGIESVFNKRHIFDYQSEYRFAFHLKDAKSEPQTINIGAITHLARKVPTKSLATL